MEWNKLKKVRESTEIIGQLYKGTLENDSKAFALLTADYGGCNNQVLIDPIA